MKRRFKRSLPAEHTAEALKALRDAAKVLQLETTKLNGTRCFSGYFPGAFQAALKPRRATKAEECDLEETPDLLMIDPIAFNRNEIIMSSN
jgi:hypothetical protein